MANPLAIALALYGGYKGYKAGKERGGGIKSILGATLGATAGYYGGEYLGPKLGIGAGTAETVATGAETAAKLNAAGTGTGAVTAAQAQGTGLAAEQLSRQAVLPAVSSNAASPGILGSVGNFIKDKPGIALGTAAGLGLYGSGAFETEPYDRTQFTYNVAYPELYRNRQFFVQDPQTGETVQQAQLDYIPEENKKFVGDDSFGPYGMATKKMNTGGLVDVLHFVEGGMPTKTTHDENDASNYKRAAGYVADLTANANKDEDTILAQLADGEFVTRTDGILGAGILMGADPKDPKEMRKKGAEFFYDQQKKMKRLYDLFDKDKKTVN